MKKSLKAKNNKKYNYYQVYYEIEGSTQKEYFKAKDENTCRKKLFNYLTHYDPSVKTGPARDYYQKITDEASIYKISLRDIFN